MRLALPSLRRPSPAQRRTAPPFLRNETGSAAIEFALVSIPFLLFVLSIIGVGLYFFTTSSLEHGVEAAARQIRTGEAQKTGLTVGQFKTEVCDQAGGYIDCNKLHVLVQHASSWTGITPQPCIDSSYNIAPSTGESDDLLSDYSGSASEVVLVTLCYEWDMAQTFGFLKLGKNADGSGPAVVQAATAFRTEPYS